MKEKEVKKFIRNMCENASEGDGMIALCGVLMLIHEDLKNIYKEIEQLPHRRPSGMGPM